MITTGTTFFIIVLFIFVVGSIAYSLLFGWKKTTSKKEVWECSTCKIELIRSQIKFGLCPKCGNKVPHFRGVYTRSLFGSAR